MRKGELQRSTKETTVNITMNLDGSGIYHIDTGIGFFNHMLELLSCHSGIDITVKCDGDTNVDFHHTVEDVGITLGKLIYKLLGDKRGIKRYASSFIPMDESLARCVIDVSGRPYLAYDCGTMSGIVGDFDTELVEEFFRSLTSCGLITAHIAVLSGHNNHHMAEAIFKAFAHSLGEAIKVVGDTIPSSKGVID